MCTQEIDELVENGVNTSQVLLELVPAAQLHGLNEIVSRCEWYKKHHLWLYENSKESFSADEIANLQEIVYSSTVIVGTRQAQLLIEISQLKESIDQTQTAATLAEHQSKTSKPDFHEVCESMNAFARKFEQKMQASSQEKRDLLLEYEQEKKEVRPKIHDMVTETLISIDAWHGRGYFPYHIKCNADAETEARFESQYRRLWNGKLH